MAAVSPQPWTLDFEPLQHQYRLNGRAVPSVTELLSIYVDFSMVDPEILEAARQFGQHVHEACHLFDTVELDWQSLDPELVPYVRAWELFLKESDALVIASEQPLVHIKLGYAGTPDRVLSWNNRTVIPDIKATSVVPKTVGVQTAGYAAAYQDMHGAARSPERACIHLHPEKRHPYSIHRRRDPKDWSYFLSALNVWRFNHD